MLRAILNQNQAQILKDERAALERLQVLLAGWEASAEDQKILQNSLQQRLLRAIGESFVRELDRSLQRLREATAPFSRFVRAEQVMLSRIEQELGDISALLAQIRQQVEE